MNFTKWIFCKIHLPQLILGCPEFEKEKKLMSLVLTVVFLVLFTALWQFFNHYLSIVPFKFCTLTDNLSDKPSVNQVSLPTPVLSKKTQHQIHPMLVLVGKAVLSCKELASRVLSSYTSFNWNEARKFCGLNVLHFLSLDTMSWIMCSPQEKRHLMFDLGFSGRYLVPVLDWWDSPAKVQHFHCTAETGVNGLQLCSLASKLL